MSLTKEQWSRYARHLTLDDVGLAGQQKLLAGRVLVVGAGGLGSPGLLYLAAAGVGTIGIVDVDDVEMSNLQRQVVHTTQRVGLPKIESARQAIHDLNPDVKVVELRTRLTSANALEILADYDILVDGSDNFPTRYLTNDACVMAGKPNVFACVQGFAGQASVFWPGGPQGGGCYRCLFPDPPPPGAVPSCSEAGVLGILPGTMGLIQATEVVKILLGKGETLAGRLLLYDAMAMTFRTIKVRRNPHCPVCGDNPEITKLIDYEMFCASASGNAHTTNGNQEGTPMENITVEDLQARMECGDDLIIFDVRNPDEYEAGTIPGARLLPLPELADRLDEIADLKGKEIIIHCQKGGRSARACAFLTEHGFKHPVNVEGGYVAWQQMHE